MAILSFACVSARTKLPDGAVRDDGRTGEVEASDGAPPDAAPLDRLPSVDAAADVLLAEVRREAPVEGPHVDGPPPILDGPPLMPDGPPPMPDAPPAILDAPVTHDAPPDLPPDAPPCPDDRPCGAGPSCGGRTKTVNLCRGGACAALASTCRGQCNAAGTDCEPCGEANQSCCGSPNPACNGTLVCAGGRCQSCGANGKICCAGNACNTGLTCERGSCVPCGARDQPCCPGNQCDNPTWMPPPAEPLACQFGLCTKCGGETGAPCCALPVGGECGPQHFCREDDRTCAR
jgi:hypothetical protein